MTRGRASALRVLGVGIAATSAILVVHWARQIALRVPEAYPGQHRAGLFLNLAIMMGAPNGSFVRPPVRIALLMVSAMCLAVAWYFLTVSAA